MRPCIFQDANFVFQCCLKGKRQVPSCSQAEEEGRRGGRKRGGPPRRRASACFPHHLGTRANVWKNRLRRDAGGRKTERQITGHSCAASVRSGQRPVLIRAAESTSRCQGGRPGMGEVPSPARRLAAPGTRPRPRAPRTGLLPGAPAPHAAPPNDRASRPPTPSPRPRRTLRARPGPVARPRATFSGPWPESNRPTSPGRTQGLLCSLHLPPPSPSPVGLGFAEGRGAPAQA